MLHRGVPDSAALSSPLKVKLAPQRGSSDDVSGISHLRLGYILDSTDEALVVQATFPFKLWASYKMLLLTKPGHKRGNFASVAQIAILQALATPRMQRKAKFAQFRRTTTSCKRAF